MTIGKMLLSEIEQEAATTRRVLERIPEDKLSWKPHEKSFSLGTLGLHVATAPQELVDMASKDVVGPDDFHPPTEPTEKAQILKAFDDAQASIKAYLEAMSDEDAHKMWKLMSGDKEIWVSPRVGLVRVIAMNHIYHHRGQLSVYLRLLDVPVPSIYGPSADEPMPM